MNPQSTFRIALVTCGTLEEARTIAHHIIDKRLGACVNILTHAIESFYSWEGKFENSSEYLMIIKTTAERLDELQREVLRLHSYDTPEFIALPIIAGSEKYLQWLSDSVKNK
ncbi:MAG: divalent-cation tolerance protein CutA [Candidatus Acidiferrum sp.]